MSLYNRYLLPRLMNLAMGASVLDVYRRRTIAQARGTVLELGFGSGINLPYYDPAKISRFYALEPDAAMLRLARSRAAKAGFPVEIMETGAETIPLPDGSIDTVVSTWTLCTIPDIETALAEVRRVLKPEGRFVFVEHGLSPDPKVARWQHRLTPFWRRCAGGCHLNRQTDAMLQDAGFELSKLETGYLGRPKTMTYMFEGRTANELV